MHVGPLCNLQIMQAQPSLHEHSLHCPLTESVDTVVYVDEQTMPRTDCSDEHAVLDLRCSSVIRALFPSLASVM